MTYKRLGELLVANGVITNLQLSIALAAQETSHRRLGEIVVERGFATEEGIAKCLADQFGYDLIDIESVTPQPAALGSLLPDFALEHEVLPIEMDDQTFTCVVSDPVNVVATDELAKLTRRRVVVKVSPPRPLLQKIRDAYQLNEGDVPSSLTLDLPARFGGLRPRRSIGDPLLYDAIDHELDRRVTLATLNFGTDLDRGFRKRVQAAARAPHRYVVAIHDLFEYQGRTWAVFERFEGETLAHVLRTRGARGLSQSAELVSQLAEGLETLHTAGGYTGLVNPSNVLIRPGGPLLLPLAGSSEEYGAPELDTGALPTALTDVYALGTLLWESLRGENPHGKAIGRWSEVSSNEPGMPGAMVEILAKACAKMPEHRTASALLLAKGLRAFNWASVPTGTAPRPVEKDREHLLAALDTNPYEAPKKGFWARLFGRAA